MIVCNSSCAKLSKAKKCACCPSFQKATWPQHFETESVPSSDSGRSRCCCWIAEDKLPVRVQQSWPYSIMTLYSLYRHLADESEDPRSKVGLPHQLPQFSTANPLQCTNHATPCSPCNNSYSQRSCEVCQYFV